MRSLSNFNCEGGTGERLKYSYDGDGVGSLSH